MKCENLALSKSGNYKSTEKMVIPGNLVADVLCCVSINPVLSTIKLSRWFIVFQEVAEMPDIGTYYWWIAQASEKTSNRMYLLKVAQTVQYLARPG